MSNKEQLPMNGREQLPMSRTTITIVVVLLLCAAGLAYSQGWFNWSSSSYEMESNKVGATQTIDQENTKADTVNVSQKTEEPAKTATK